MSGKMLIEFDLVFLYLGIYPKEKKSEFHIQKKLCAKIFLCTTLFVSENLDLI